LEPNLPERQALAIVERSELVLGIGARAEVDARAFAVAQLEMSGEEIGVEVSQKDVANPAPQPVGVLDIVVDVALRIDRRPQGGGIVGDQVGSMGQAAEVVLLKDPRLPPSPLEVLVGETSTPRYCTPKTPSMNNHESLGAPRESDPSAGDPRCHAFALEFSEL